MEFVHQPYIPGETIAAIATPPGEGGVAIIRISGTHAVDVAAKIYSGPIRTYASHTAHFGSIHNLNNEHIDDVLILPMLGKRSYTGENTVEIHCHGGSIVSRKVLEATIAAGARAARPGEFTFKAYINGKLDLAQAEAVQALIAAKNEHALNAAEAHLKGSLSQKIAGFQQELTTVAAILEAWVDFPEEGLEFATMEELTQQLTSIQHTMETLANTFHDGKIIHDGLSLCLVGRPNAGKSSLMNALLDKERAIVSHIPGTTRDVLEDHFRLNGLNLRLMDTAGIRQSDEIIEQEGIRRSKEAIGLADLILLILDITDSHMHNESWLAELPKDKTIVVWNKVDLPHGVFPKIDFPHSVSLSAKQRTGLEELKAKIDQVIWHSGPPSKEEILITNVRHRDALHKAIEGCKAVVHGLHSGVSPEFLTSDLRVCLVALGTIIGTNITEDVLSAIFSKFCIGK